MIIQPKLGDNLQMAAARLKMAAPNTFKEFEDAVAALTVARSAECVQAPPDGVLKAQGKALQMQELDRWLKNCTEDAKALTAKLQPKEKV